MFNEYETLKDIPTFLKELVEEFTNRSMIKLFRTKDIPQFKNKPNVNNSDATEKDEHSQDTQNQA